MVMVYYGSVSMGNTVTLGQNDFSSLACNDNSEPKQPHQSSGRRNIEQTVDGGDPETLWQPP